MTLRATRHLQGPTINSERNRLTFNRTTLGSHGEVMLAKGENIFTLQRNTSTGQGITCITRALRTMLNMFVHSIS